MLNVNIFLILKLNMIFSILELNESQVEFKIEM